GLRRTILSTVLAAEFAQASRCVRFPGIRGMKQAALPPTSVIGALSVITTDRAPMTEVGGNAACFIPRMPGKRTQREAWANSAARTVDRIVRLKPGERASVLAEG